MKRLIPRIRRLLHFESSKLLLPASITTTDPTASSEIAKPHRQDTNTQVESQVSCRRGGPQAGPGVNISQSNARVENLLPEVLHDVLAMLDLDDLSAMIHASPIFHRQYILHRRLLLCQSLETTLRHATGTAYTVFRTNSDEFSRTRTQQAIAQILQSYHNSYNTVSYKSLSELLTEEEAVCMSGFYSSTVSPVIRRYANWAQSNLSAESKCQDIIHHPLSRAERSRLVRAMYRFQLCCNLFGTVSRSSLTQASLRVKPEDILNMFFTRYEPWEVEEVACVYSFAKETYNKIFSDVRWDIDEKNPKFDGQRPPTPEGAFDLENSCLSHHNFFTLIIPDLQSISFVTTILIT